MKTSACADTERAERDDPPEEMTVTRVEILPADRFVERDDAASPERPSDSRASPAGSEISVHRESWRDIVSPGARAPWRDSQASLASSDASAPAEARDGPDERWSDTLTSPPSSDVSGPPEARERWSECRSPPDAAPDPLEPSEVYYSASSDASLVSDAEPDAPERRQCVMAGHVAAMRERFESMTRANTPCAELARSASPSLDVFRNITPSPDRLG